MRETEKQVTEKNKLWLAVLGEIELSLSRGNYITWFKSSQLASFDNDVAVVGVANIFIKNHLEQRYSDLILELL
ncbi:MAG: DnaA N-terminal domain-containing protein, partial [Candidatus Saccharimonadales bacterium]